MIMSVKYDNCFKILKIDFHKNQNEKKTPRFCVAKHDLNFITEIMRS